ncbi:FMRF-Like Peptide [Caenorhabditis elegans]|uniref:FMRF-Like Peptide n=1 Tax=Caenorhabditis elegans TaxID=6239 RepID=Q9TZK3_CAEEL|nr:FMRF-Like Peptide [Caenorhabditis elegans]CCD66152.1 FMRF-Like Peptide [Caenorhabditis elegans]|eukprot:NP_495232.2 Uncharacterized protein CELE_F40H3.2 [Caenorhabditis elegans]
MNLPLTLIFVSVLISLVSSLGELPENTESAEDAAFVLNSGDFRRDEGEDVTVIDGPTPPSVVAAPLDPLPEMSIPVARPPGFRPPPSFKSKKDSGEHAEPSNVGFVVRRGRAKVMGFSRRKSESTD